MYLTTASGFQSTLFLFLLLTPFRFTFQVVSAQDGPLPSWSDDGAKQVLIEFVSATTTPGSPSFISPNNRIAVFDDGGTLWPESPVPFHFAFAMNEIKRLNPKVPIWDTNDLIQAVVSGEQQSYNDSEMANLSSILAEQQVGLTTDEFTQRIQSWAMLAKHPRFKRRYLDLAYQPMLEVIALLKSKGFTCYIIVEHDADFVRAWSQTMLGIPPDQVFGPFAPVAVELRDGKPVVIKSLGQPTSQPDSKLIAIHRHIGRYPVLCFANSDTDEQVLKATTARTPSLGVIIHHTDQEREYVYDEQPSSTGKLSTVLEMATSNHWTVVDMKTDWKDVFMEPAQSAPEFAGVPTGIDFVVEEVSGTGVIDSSGAIIRFEPDNQVSGSTGCNRFSGATIIGAEQLVIGPISMTRRACAPAIMDQEKRISQALQQVATYRFDDKTDILHFYDKDSQSVMRLSRVIDSRE